MEGIFGNACAHVSPERIQGCVIYILRAPDQKYRESHDRSKISYFILFHQKYLFGKLFSKIILSSFAFSFFKKLEKFKIRLEACLRPPEQGKIVHF